MAVLLALLAFGSVAAAGVLWFRRLQEVRIVEVRGRVIAWMAAGVGLAALALLAGAGGLIAGLAFTALAVGGLFLGLQLVSRQARVEPAVGLGGPILDISATDDAGESFELASLRGKPFLLKFFRGHW